MVVDHHNSKPKVFGPSKHNGKVSFLKSKPKIAQQEKPTLNRIFQPTLATFDENSPLNVFSHCKLSMNTKFTPNGVQMKNLWYFEVFEGFLILWRERRGTGEKRRGEKSERGENGGKVGFLYYFTTLIYYIRRCFNRSSCFRTIDGAC